MEQQLRAGLMARAAPAPASLAIVNDTIGPIWSATGGAGGVCLIAGTGSNCRGITEHGEIFGAGGWGNMIGDEGSAWFVAQSAIHRVIRISDGLVDPCEPVREAQALQRAIFDYFAVDSLRALLPTFYTNFNKAHIAGFCVRVADAAAAGDGLALDVMRSAARWLGLHIKAVVPKMSTTMRESTLGVTIVATGSVWLAWPVLRDTFVATVTSEPHALKRFRLVRLTESAATGAALLAAHGAGLAMHLDTSVHVELLHHQRD